MKRLPDEVINIMRKLDATTYNHSYRMFNIALQMEYDFGMKNENFSIASFVHDIGKVYIPELILDKRKGLNGLERQLIDLHSYIGYRILDKYEIEEDVKRMVLYHHTVNPILMQPVPEYDISGIERQIKMLHTLDVFEALTTDRPYKRRMSVSEACHFMEQDTGYDKEVLEYLREQVSDFDALSREMAERSNHGCV